MTEHTHLSGINVGKDGAIHFSFETHEDHPQAIAGLAVPEDHDAAKLMQQLNALAQFGALKPEQVQGVAAELPDMQALYKPETPPKKEPAKNDAVLGEHTARYMQEASGQSQGHSL